MVHSVWTGVNGLWVIFSNFTQTFAVTMVYKVIRRHVNAIVQTTHTHMYHTRTTGTLGAAIPMLAILRGRVVHTSRAIWERA